MLTVFVKLSFYYVTGMLSDSDCWKFCKLGVLLGYCDSDLVCLPTQ